MHWRTTQGRRFDQSGHRNRNSGPCLVSSIEIGNTDDRVSFAEAFNIRCDGFGAGPRHDLTGDMRSHDHAWMRPVAVVSRQGFFVKDIKESPSDLAAVERIEQILVNDMSAPADVCDISAARHRVEGLIV